MKKRSVYHYTECGLDYVYLTSGFKVLRSEGKEVVEVENPEQLQRTIADAIVNHQSKLNGTEIKFLRRLMKMTQPELGELLGKDAQSIARWEKGQNELPSAEDRILRQIYLETSGAHVPFMETSRKTASLAKRLEAVHFGKPQLSWVEDE